MSGNQSSPAARDRAQRIIETAVELAEQGGFEAVRLRDVAANAGVALGTLYRYFRSKEDLLVAALSQEVQAVLDWMKSAPLAGETPLERVKEYFTVSTDAMIRKPRFARAMLRSAACGEPELTGKLTRFNRVLREAIVAAMHGEPLGASTPSEEEEEVAGVLYDVWFASLIGWMGGLHDRGSVVGRVTRAAELILEGTRESRLGRSRLASGPQG